MTFEEDIRKWAALDTKIADINSTVKGLRNEKNEVEQSILAVSYTHLTLPTKRIV